MVNDWGTVQIVGRGRFWGTVQVVGRWRCWGTVRVVGRGRYWGTVQIVGRGRSRISKTVRGICQSVESHYLDYVAKVR